MHSQKEYETKIRKITKELAATKAKLAKVEALNKDRGKLIGYLRRRVRLLELSREKWKNKYGVKKLEINKLSNDIKRAGKAKWHHYTMFVVNLVVLLRVKCNCSYGSIVKILTLLNSYLNLGLEKIPCANTMQNWVSKGGLYCLEKGVEEQGDKKVSIIIDESIRLGQEKLLLVLICPFIKVGKKALSLLNVQIMYMKGSKSWKGVEIAKEIKEKLLSKGLKVGNILSDEGSNLKNAANQLKLPHLPDIGHALATCLKQTFAKQTTYILFTKLIASYLSKGVNQDLSYLCPPKLGKKARFMNQSRVINWAEIMLINWEKLNETEKEFFAQLAEHKEMIDILDTCMTIAKIIAISLKKEGLSIKTLNGITRKLKKYQKEEGLVKVFLTKVEGYLVDYKDFLNKYAPDCCIHVSSDIIESIFGVYKNKANNYALTGLTKLNLELPLYCMDQKEIIQITQLALEGISMTYLSEWVNEYSADNQLVRRLKFRKAAA